jgi:hypothetical protein
MNNDNPRDPHMEALHPTRSNHWKYHWFDADHFPPPNHTKNCWRPSCNNDGCGYWNCRYDCNKFPASLLVDKAKFMARRQLEGEYPETPHPNLLLLRPHHLYYVQTLTTKMTPKERSTRTGISPRIAGSR